jgi:hypothetical protein
MNRRWGWHHSLAKIGEIAQITNNMYIVGIITGLKAEKSM